MSVPGTKISDAAAALGVATHVLRHWEDVGVLVPERLDSGHRVYRAETIDRGRLILMCQRAGLSLAEIKELGAVGQGERVALIAAKRAGIAERIANLELADQFLAHVVTCVHPVISECPDCSRLVGQVRVRGRVW